MNPWFSQENHERELTILGGTFGNKGNTQNTVFALFEPNAPGLSADSFPTYEAIYFGTRPGRRYPFLTKVLPTKELAAMVTKRWLQDTNDPNPDPNLIQRIVWEYENGKNGDDIAKVMTELAAKYPGKAGAADELPLLPVMPDLMQALNIAAADSRAVIAVVHPAPGGAAMERTLTPLAFEEGIAGRTHMARLTAEEWASAKAEGQISGSSLASGVIFVAPDPYGLVGEVWAEIGSDASQDEMRQELQFALDRFHKEWRKSDRKSHLQNGSAQGITWSEYDPEAGRVIKLPVNIPSAVEAAAHH